MMFEDRESDRSEFDRRDFLKKSVKTAGAAIVLAGVPSNAIAVQSPPAYLCGLSLWAGDVPPIDVSGTISGNKTYTSGFRVRSGTTLRFDPNVSTTITVKANIVVEGVMEMKPSNKNVTHRLVFDDVNEAAFVGGGIDPIASDVGLWVMGSGRLDIKGHEKNGWNRDGWHSSWEAGDEVRVAPTARGDFGGGGFSTFGPGSTVPSVDLKHPIPANVTFSDTIGNVHLQNIEALAASGITAGCASGRFCPAQNVTRGQMAAFLDRWLKFASAPSAGFSDTKGHQFEKEIDRLAQEKITAGCGEDTFCPDDYVTRGQMAAFLDRALNFANAPSAGFSDTKGHLFEKDIDRLANEGVTVGCGNNKFCPDDYVTRGQMASFLTRAFNLPIPEVDLSTTINAEVFNLTRNVHIEGKAGGRAHVFIRSNSAQSIKYAEFKYLAPRKNEEGVLGRYSLHFHFCGNGSRGSIVEGVVARKTGNHAFVPHASHGVSFYDCIAYDCLEDAYWYDDVPPDGVAPRFEGHQPGRDSVQGRRRCRMRRQSSMVSGRASESVSQGR